MTRRCSKCEKDLPYSEFYADKRVKDGLTRRCRTCHSGSSYSSRRKNPEQATPSLRREYNREFWRRRRYDLSTEEYNALLTAQEGLCAICNKPERDTWRGNLKDLAVDHDHKTGKVRGLLCSQCNTGIGKFQDSLELMKAAIEYLERCEG